MKRIIYLVLLSTELYGMDRRNYWELGDGFLEDSAIYNESKEEEKEQEQKKQPEEKSHITQADFEAAKNELAEANPPSQTILNYMPEEVIITWAEQNGWYHE